MHPAEGNFDVNGYENAVDAIVGIITRRPMRQDELERTLNRWSPEQVGKALEELKASGRVQIVERLGFHFWSAAPSIYPDEIHSERTIPSNSKFPKKGHTSHEPRESL